MANKVVGSVRLTGGPSMHGLLFSQYTPHFLEDNIPVDFHFIYPLPGGKKGTVTIHLAVVESRRITDRHFHIGGILPSMVQRYDYREPQKILVEVTNYNTTSRKGWLSLPDFIFDKIKLGEVFID